MVSRTSITCGGKISRALFVSNRLLSTYVHLTTGRFWYMAVSASPIADSRCDRAMSATSCHFFTSSWASLYWRSHWPTASSKSTTLCSISIVIFPPNTSRSRSLFSCVSNVSRRRRGHRIRIVVRYRLVLRSSGLLWIPGVASLDCGKCRQGADPRPLQSFVGY